MKRLWCLWVFLVLATLCTGQTSCPNECLNGGTQDDNDCSCPCPNGCQNGGIQENSDCSCWCPNDCQNGGTQNNDCSCWCPNECLHGKTLNDDCSCWCSNSCPKFYYLNETDCSCQPSDCPVGWEVAQPASQDSARRCYKRFNDPVPSGNGQLANFWRYDRVDGCPVHGAQLATFTTRAEFDAASAACKTDPVVFDWAAGCWTDGVVDQETTNKTGEWRWGLSANDSAAFLRSGEEGLWSSDQPSAIYAQGHPVPEKCVQFLDSGLLNDFVCEWRLPSAICMREQPPCSTVRTCQNGGTQNPTDCSCSCSNGCLNNGTRNDADCSWLDDDTHNEV